MTFQLRRYAVKPGALDTFIREWRSSVLPIRGQYGFAVVGAWHSTDESTFVWIVRHDGPEDFESANRVYYESDERRNMAADPARHILAVETLEMISVDVGSHAP